MSVRRLSPTADLLKTSRLFSLPPPLARPVSELGFAANSTSDTATLPYPIHASIETSEGALARGDWGLKRPLPLKSTTRTSTPCVSIENIDSIDHITDFSSAAPYSRTVEKWQETDLSFSRHVKDKRISLKGALKSAFESDHDNTDTKRHSAFDGRWKFEGPWLGGQTDGEFSQYLQQQVKNRKSEFRQFLRRFRSRELIEERKQKLREEMQGEDEVMAVEEEYRSLTDEELNTFIKGLRKTPNLLDRYIQAFLDLPRGLTQSDNVVTKEVQDSSPPSTHPSAGLSYQRSHSHTFNHPLYGPQENKPPVEARVLLAQTDARRYQRLQAVFGVAGVSAEDTRLAYAKSSEAKEVAQFDPDSKGGAKTWLQLRRATITPQGRVELGTQKADPNALDAKGLVKKPPLPQAAQQGAETTSVPSLTDIPSRNRTSKGFGLESLSDIPRSSRAEPFGGTAKLLDTLEKQTRTVYKNA